MSRLANEISLMEGHSSIFEAGFRNQVLEMEANSA
jgi:hypothetical protein